MSETLADLGEAELLRRLSHFAPAGQLDDDTACLAVDPRPLLVNTDVLVDGIHFSDATTDATDVGWRAVAANLSDLAASGAEAVEGVTVALVAPGNTPWDWVNGVYQGMSEALHRHGGVLLGGDCSDGAQRLLSVSALGRLGPLHLHRSQARPGDVLVVSGPHGLSRLGLALLQNDPAVTSQSIPESLRKQAVQQHRRPSPRFDALQALVRSKPKSLPWRAGGTDSSDGLLAAVEGLCKSSACGAVLDRAQLPRPQNWPMGSPWDHWCLAGGEDFELVLSLPPEWVSPWLELVPGAQRIGSISSDPVGVRWSDDQSVIHSRGFAHYDHP